MSFIHGRSVQGRRDAGGEQNKVEQKLEVGGIVSSAINNNLSFFWVFPGPLKLAPVSSLVRI